MSAVHSLFHSPESKSALAGNIGGLARVQEVRTPACILDAVRAAFGHAQIDFDPCAATDRTHWIAVHNLCLPPEASGLQAEIAHRRRMRSTGERDERLAKLQRDLKAVSAGGALAMEWPHDRMFWNPPFDALAMWMRKAFRHGADGSLRSVGLIPVRPHRRWWTEYAKGANGVWLAPLAFEGNKSSFPAPLCLLARNCEIPPLGKIETGRFNL